MIGAARTRHFFLALAGALLAAGAGGCCSCAGSPDFTIRAASVQDPPPAPPLVGPALLVLHVADFGDATCQQQAVADGFLAAHHRAPFDVALFAGDNLYGCGPDARVPGADGCAFASDGSTLAAGFTPPRDVLFGLHERPIGDLASAPAAEVLLALGNHDVGAPASCRGSGDPVTARRRACLEVAHRSALWRMDGRHWLADRGPARFLFVDSNLLIADYGGFSIDDEVAFVAAAAPGCRADVCDSEPDGCSKPWCFLVAHHPAATAGSHGSDHTLGYGSRVARLLAAGGGRIRAWMAGHDHDLQHLREPSGVDVLVSGNGAHARASERFETVVPAGAELLYASVHWGFGVLEVADSGWRYRFESEAGEALYCCAAEGPGRCEPVRCW